MKLGVIVAVLAGCGGPGGVEVVVTPTDNVQRIALFTGVGDEIDQNIAPENVTSPYFNTKSWVRDPDNDKSYVEGVTGQPISFGLLGPADPISILIAVGFDANNGVVAAAVLPGPLEVPEHAVARFELALQPVSTVDAQSPLEVHVWKPTDPSAPGDPSSCVLVLDKPSGEKVAVVSPDDQDCDGWLATDPKECVKSTFMSGRPPKLDSSIHCALPTTYTVSMSTVAGAILGGDSCTDGMGLVAGCEASNYCIPHSLYDGCNGAYPCMQNVATLSPGYSMSVMRCTLATDLNGQLCPDPIPAIANSPNLNFTHTCKSGTQRITYPGQVWSDHIVATVGDVPDTTQVKLTVGDIGSDCHFTITPEGPALPLGALVGTLIATDLDNGHGVAIPFVFGHGADGCGNPQPCTLTVGSSAEGLEACMDSPLVGP